MKKWYEELFTNYARSYEKEVYTRGTLQEVGFIEREIRRDRRVRILDVGCGTGRHSIELAKRGYRVTGIDLSASQLAYARRKARAAGVKVDFRRKDARSFDFQGKFGLVIMLCEGGFSLMETDEENYRILAGCARSLRTGGKLIFTALNALFPLGQSVKKFPRLQEGRGLRLHRGPLRPEGEALAQRVRTADDRAALRGPKGPRAGEAEGFRSGPHPTLGVRRRPLYTFVCAR